MLHSSGHRACCYLFVALTIVSPLPAFGEIKLAPLVDLNPQHHEPASAALQAPRPLVVAAQAISLSALESNDNKTSHIAPQIIKSTRLTAKDTDRGTSTPAIKLATPFDPTKARQQAADQIADVVTLAPIVTAKEPAARERTQHILPRLTAKPTEQDIARARPPVEVVVHRSVFIATTGERLQRTFTTRLPIIRRHDRTSKLILAALSDMTINGPFDAKSETIVAAKPLHSDTRNEHRPRLTGLIQLADSDPLAKQNKALIVSQHKLSTPAKSQAVASSPIVVQATQPLIDLARRNAEPNAKAHLELSSPKEALVVAIPNEPAKAEKVEARSAIVELVANPLADKDATEQPAGPTQAITSTSPIIKPVADALALQPKPQPDGNANKLAVSAREAVVAFAESAPLLARLQQQSPSASDLPSPDQMRVLTEEEIAEAEEIAAIESDLKPIQSVLAMTKPEAGEMPKDYASKRFAQAGQVTHRMGHSRTNMESQLMWEAPAIAHRPLYFEDINLERHGYKIPIVQPAVSAAHFFGRVPLLPYLAASEGHREPQYTLGHYRPGDYAPYSLYVPKLKLDGSIAEAAFMTGIMFAFP